MFKGKIYIIMVTLTVLVGSSMTIWYIFNHDFSKRAPVRAKQVYFMTNTFLDS